MNAPTPNSSEILDRQIDRALDTLGEAGPAPDFHNRLLKALNDSATASPCSVISDGRDTRQPRWEAGVIQRWRRYGFATAALAAGFAVFVLMAHQTAPRFAPRKTPHLQASRLPNAAPSSKSASPVTNSGGPSLTAIYVPARAGSLLPDSTAATSVHPTPPDATLELSATAPSDLDQQALADLHAPSRPAPPLPLTTQERLVGLMLRSGEKQELAQLNPEEQAVFAQQEQSAFHDFFDPPLDPRLRAKLDGTEPPSATTPQPSQVPQSQGATK